jgi:hypothetical protein
MYTIALVIDIRGGCRASGRLLQQGGIVCSRRRVEMLSV